jgi:Na+-driven multidrug efflux pump
MGEPAQPAPRSNGDRSPWNWLLIIPIAVPLIPVLYNAIDPTFLGFPLFYWLQLAFIGLGVLTTTLVYQMTKRRSDSSEAKGGQS